MIVGLSGYAGSGKDTAGAYLARRYGFRVTHYAEPLKRIVGEIFGFTEAQLHGDEKETPDPRFPRADGLGFLTPRYALQHVGTEGFRALYSRVWVDATMNRIADGDRVAVCDVRFPDEAAAIRARGGRVIRILRGEPESAHRSEHALANRPDLFDAVIDNRSTSLGAFFARVDRTVGQWLPAAP
ncbi:MAG: hypothetical protein RID81_07235 [Sandaracinaceae bacterium]